MSEQVPRDDNLRSGVAETLIADVERYLGNLTEENEATLAGDFEYIGDQEAFHEKMETIRWWLTTPFVDEIEEDEED